MDEQPEEMRQKGRGGRPKKAAAELRTVRLPAVRLTEGEAAYIEEQAARAGRDVSGFVRELATTLDVKPVAPVADVRLLTELNAIGNNLNQIARSLNTDRPERASLPETLDELRRILAILATRL